MIAPQELIERITAAADYHDCIVIVEAKTQANLRWASSTLTTNGVIAEQSVTVIAFISVKGGMATGSVSRTNVTLDEIASIAKEASLIARAAGAAEDSWRLERREMIRRCTPACASTNTSSGESRRNPRGD